MAVVKTVQDKGDKAALLILDDGSKPIWTPDRELARTLLGKPIPPDWVRKDGEYGPQAFPPKAKGQGRYRDTKEAFDREAESRRAWQLEEEDRRDKRTALMQAVHLVATIGETEVDVETVAEKFYDWLRRSAPSPTGHKTSLGEAGGVDTGPGEGPSLPSPGFPVDPAECSHKTASGKWVWWADDGSGGKVCPKCGTPKLVAMEGTTEDLGPA